MPKAPPPLPEEILRRVLRIGHSHGLCVTLVAGLFALASAAAHDVTGAVVCVLVAGGGAMEMHGATMLGAGSARGLRWLISGEFCVLIAILGYVAWRLGHPDPLMLEAMRAAIGSEQRQQMKELGISEAEFLHMLLRLVCFAVGFASVIYQGGMMFYYARRRGAVEKALEGHL